VLPTFNKDTTDRNRTSPFAFTGNKFEFRMPGSSASVSGANIAINTAVAEELKQFADELERAEDREQFDVILNDIIRRTVKNHKRIIFNGDGYSEAWEKEAESRGLSNFKTTVDALPSYISEKNIKLFTEHRVFTAAEVHSRYEIRLEIYCKTLNIEALTMIEMAKRDILPAVTGYSKKLADTIIAKRGVLDSLDCTAELSILQKLSKATGEMYVIISELEGAATDAKAISGIYDRAKYYRDTVIPLMEKLRTVVDSVEPDVEAGDWPYPSYGELLYRV
jgi:glutamine synthetase